MDEKKVNEIMDEIFKDENLCIVRNALEAYEEKDQNQLDIEQFNQDYAHLTLYELEEDLERCKEQHANGDFMSEEIKNLDYEINLRKQFIDKRMKLKK